VLGGVHDPDRLTILSPCAVVDGVVVRAPKLNPSDGDVTFNVRPDAAYASMMNSKNVGEGGLHVEVVPADQTGCTSAGLAKLPAAGLGSCTGANVALPPLNAHVRVIGPFVHDRWVGWNEIHPAWHVDLVVPGGPPPPEQHTFAAVLRGSAVAKRAGAPTGRGTVALTLTEERLCWRFGRLVRTGSPTRAALRVPGARPAVAVALGARYRVKGCVRLTPRALSTLQRVPRSFVVTVFTRAHPKGSIQGALFPTSD
jgi:hypothetical protein